MTLLRAAQPQAQQPHRQLSQHQLQTRHLQSVNRRATPKPLLRNLQVAVACPSVPRQELVSECPLSVSSPSFAPLWGSATSKSKGRFWPIYRSERPCLNHLTGTFHGRRTPSIMKGIDHGKRNTLPSPRRRTLRLNCRRLPILSRCPPDLTQGQGDVHPV